MFFKEDKKIQVSEFDIETKLFVGTYEFNAEKGFSLPPNLTQDICPEISGKIGLWSGGEWVMIEDDRGRVFYLKANGERYVTKFVGEVVDKTEFTQVEKPKLKIDQLCYFDIAQQKWIVGFDWYEKPIWNAQQEKSFCTDLFFVPDSHTTNIEPTEDQVGWGLNELGEWVEPEPEPEEQAEQE